MQALETRSPFHQEQKGKDGHDQDKGLVLGSFLVPEIDMIFGDGVGASLVVVVVVVVKETHMPLPRSRRWALLEEAWKEDADMNDRHALQWTRRRPPEPRSCL